MERYKCGMCDEVFEGENAQEEIKNHLLECAMIKIEEKKPTEIEKRLKEKYPFIEKTEERIQDFDEPNELMIYRNDGSKYRVFFPYFSFGSKRKVDDFQHLNEQIDKKEKLINEITNAVLTFKPRSNIRFIDIRENTGTLGDGYVFEFFVKSEKKVRTFYRGDDAIGKIKAYYADKIEGRIEGVNGNYTVDGISVNEWLSLNHGKEVRFEKVDIKGNSK